MTYDVFLCHNSQDKPAVREINEVLRQEFDLSTFLDESTLVGGEQWAAGIASALAGSASCAVLLGQHGWGTYQRDEEARAAIARQQSDPQFRVIPVILPGASEAAMAELPELFKSRHWVDLRNGLLDRATLRGLAFAVRGQNPFPEGKPALTPARLRFDGIRWDAGLRRDDSILYTGAELREAEALAAARAGELTDLARVFLEVSRQRQIDRRGQLLAAHASALAQDQLPLAARLAALALEHRDSADAHAVLRRAAAWLPTPVRRLEHHDRVTALACSGDGRRLLTAAANGSVILWDAESLQAVTEVSHGSKVSTVAIDPTGDWFVTGGEDGMLGIWDAHNGARRQALSVGSPVARIDIGGDREHHWLVAVGGELLPDSPGVAVAWECATWEQRWRNALVRDAAIAAGGEMTVLAINDHFVMVNNAAGTVAGDAALDGQVTAVTAHPTAPVFLATTLMGRLWKIALQGDQFQGSVLREGVLAIERATFSPDGARIAIFAADLQFVVLTPSGPELIVPYEGMFGLRASFATDRSLVAIHSAEAKTTTLWHQPTRTKVTVIDSQGATGVSFGSPPRLAVATLDNAVEVMLLPSGQEARWEHGMVLVTHMLFSGDGRYLARAGSPVAPDGRVEVRRHAIEVIDAHSGVIVAHVDELAEFRVLAFEGGGPSLVFERGGQPMLLDVATQQIRPTDPPPVRELASPDAGPALGAAPIADAAKRRGLKMSAISRDGRWLCVVHDRHMLSVWNLVEMKETLALSTRGEPCRMVFSTRGELIAIGDQRGNIVVCEVRGGVIARFKHAEPILNILFSPDDRFLAVASVDTALRLWPVSLEALKSQIQMPLALSSEEWIAYMDDEPSPS
jgi:WD40 repeat protein